MLKAIDYNKAPFEFKFHLKEAYLLDWTPKTYKENNRTYYYEVKLIDFNMIDLPNVDYEIPIIDTNESYYKICLRTIKKKLVNKILSRKTSSKKFYSEEEFSFVIRNYLCSKAIANRQWYLIFDQQKFYKELYKISDSIDLRDDVDHELVQSIKLKLENLFENFNKDLSYFDLTLTMETKRRAHSVIFKKLVDLYSNNNIQKAINEKSTWEQKRESLCTFFVSQLSPDQFKDLENAKQYLRLFSEIIENDLVNECNKFINDEIQKIEEEFTRLKMQEKHDRTLRALNKEQLISYVLDPTNFLLKDFEILWTDFEGNINQKLKNLQSNFAKKFRELKEFLNQINEQLLQHRQPSDTFRANDIFRLVTINTNSNTEINIIVYLKGLCAFSFLFEYITNNSTKSIYIIENEDFELDNNIKTKFSEINSNISKELKEILTLITPDLSKISINFIDLFLKNILQQIDTFSAEFLNKEYTFESLGFNKDRYMNRIKGCETSCPCCGRLCDAEHYKVQTEIGSETNKHKCNRGHQFRAFNGFKLEHSKLPSFKMCEAMKDDDRIRSKQQIYRWSDYKKIHSKWDFDSTGSASDFEYKCTYIWSIIGRELCEKFEMNYQDEARDLDANKSYEPIHFILLLDDSGSMNEKGKWNELIKSVSNFIEIRSKEGSIDDLISVVYFSDNARILIANSAIYPELGEELPNPSFGGTNYSSALKSVIEIIKQNQSKKFGIVFMSDGEASYPREEIELLKKYYLNLIYKFWTIGYGKNQNFNILKQMLRELYGSENNFKNPTDSIELSKIYVEIAREDNC